MRRRDKLKNIDRANLLAEQRYLKSKGLLNETPWNGDPNSNWVPDDDRLEVEVYDWDLEFRTSEDIDKWPDDHIFVNINAATGRQGWNTSIEVSGVIPREEKEKYAPLVQRLINLNGGKDYKVSDEQLSKNPKTKEIADILDEFIIDFAEDYDDIDWDDPYPDEDLMPGGKYDRMGENVTDGGSGFEEGAIGGVTEMESTRFPYKFYGKPLTLTDSNGKTWETSIKLIIPYNKYTYIRIGLNDKPNNIDIKPDGTIIINGLGAGNQMQAKVEGESAAMIDDIRSIVAKRQDDTINESGIKKNRKRIKITESQRRLLKSKGLLKEGATSDGIPLRVGMRIKFVYDSQTYDGEISDIHGGRATIMSNDSQGVAIPMSLMNSSNTKLAEQRYLKSKGLLKENSVTQALMGAANSGNLGGGIYDIVKNFGKNAVLAALQALMGSGDIDPQGVKNIGLIQTIQKLQENVTEDEGEHERYSQYNIDTNARLKKYASEKEEGTDWSEISDYFLDKADPYNMKLPNEKYDIYFNLVDKFLTKHGY